ncbi:MAG: hypothetical protein JW731_17055, partial [Bacteroidales bacterium]|nr:hypothetical protein [Bacteroidales bacterium]
MIIIFGFACSVAICLMIGLFLMKEYSHDRYHANADHIYRLYNAADNYSPIDYRVKDIITANYPEVENGCLVQIQSRPIETSHDNTAFYIDNMMSADS